MQRANDPRLSAHDLYMHSAENSFFLKQCQFFNSQYKIGAEFVEKSSPDFPVENFSDISLPFNNYLHYPEDIDPASLIVLVCFSEKALEDISKNKTSLKKFNNWIEMGTKNFDMD
jgi:hypothetical protein